MLHKQWHITLKENGEYLWKIHWKEKYYSNSDDTDSTPTESEPVTLTEGMEVRFTGACDTNGTPLAYTDRTYVINGFSDDREKVLLDIYGEHYAWVWASEVVPA